MSNSSFPVTLRRRQQLQQQQHKQAAKPSSQPSLASTSSSVSFMDLTPQRRPRPRRPAAPPAPPAPPPPARPSQAAPKTTTTTTTSSSTSSSTSSTSSTSFTSYLSTLNAAQREAVQAPRSQPLMIVAAAGSGKTTTLTARIANFLHQGALPQHVLAITFTRKAATELQSRVDSKIGWRQSSGMTVCNFHQLCLRILRRNYQKLHFCKQFEVYGAAAQRDLVRECLARARLQLNKTPNGSDSGLSNADFDTAALQETDDLMEERLGHAGGSKGARGGKSRVRGYDEIPSRHVNYYTSFIRQAKAFGKMPKQLRNPEERLVYGGYVRALKERCAIDFSDMIPLTLWLFRQYPDVLEQHRQMHQYIFVDEFQDVTQHQFTLLTMLAGDRRFVTVCGDDDQSIYSWRGVAVQSFSLFEKAFPQHQTVVLERTYRSTKTIVAAAGQLIANNKMRKPKRLWTQNGVGDRIHMLVSSDGDREAQRIAEAVFRLRVQHGLRFSDFAILGRTRAALRVFERVFRQKGIPLRSSPRTQPGMLRSKDIRVVLAYCRLALEAAGHDPPSEVDPADDAHPLNEAFALVHNLPSRGFGRAALQAVKHMAQRKRCSWPRACRKLVARASGSPQQFGLKSHQVASIAKYVELVKQLAHDMLERGSASVKQMLSLLVDQVGLEAYISTHATSSSSCEERVGMLNQLVQKAFYFDHHSAVTSAGEHDPAQAPVAAQPVERLARFVRNISITEAATVAPSASAAPGPGSPPAEFVTVSTIHQAKGLEWQAVFVVRFNETVLPLPHRRRRFAEEAAAGSSKPSGTTAAAAAAASGASPSSSAVSSAHASMYMEEERRLAYVAVSRARQFLTVSFVTHDATGNSMHESRFLNELPQQYISDGSASLSSQPQPAPPTSHTTPPSADSPAPTPSAPDRPTPKKKRKKASAAAQSPFAFSMAASLVSDRSSGKKKKKKKKKQRSV